METLNHKISSWTYLVWGLVAFSFLGLEFGIIFLSTLVDGRSLSQAGAWPVHWYAVVFHWTLTITLWSCGILLIWKWVIKKGIERTLIDFKITKKTLYYTAGSLFIVIAYALIESLILNRAILQIISEYQGFVKMYDSRALIVTFFQILYYAFEMLLVFIMIIMFQRWGEKLFKYEYFPYGSVFLMLTWGIIHFVSNPTGALGVVIWALIPGVVYIASGKRFLPVYISLIVAFLI